MNPTRRWRGGRGVQRAGCARGSDSDRYSGYSDGWRCQRMCIRRMTWARTGRARVMDVAAVMGRA